MEKTELGSLKATWSVSKILADLINMLPKFQVGYKLLTRRPQPSHNDLCQRRPATITSDEQVTSCLVDHLDNTYNTNTSGHDQCDSIIHKTRYSPEGS